MLTGSTPYIVTGTGGGVAILKALENRNGSVTSSRKPLYMVLVCTVLTAIAQVLLKMAADHPMPAFQASQPIPFILAVFGNYPLIFGYSVHAANALLLILALREGQLSVLYPVYALSYVWVTLASIRIFNDQMNAWKVVGVTLVILGVAVLGKVSSTE